MWTPTVGALGPRWVVLRRGARVPSPASLTGGRKGWLVVTPIAAAVLAFGGVHPGARAMLSIVCGLVLLVVVFGGERKVQTGRLSLGLALAGLVLLGLEALRATPVGPGVRSVLQPALHPLIAGSLALTGTDRAPLAVDLPAALDAWGAAVGTVALGISATFMLRTRRRRLQTIELVVATGAGLVLVAVLHRALGLEHIFGFSGIPASPREDFFGTFVNPNHAAVLLGACLPLALALTLRERTGPRLLAAGGGLLCAAGLVLAGSRGGMVLGTVGLATMLTLGLPSRVGLAVGGFATLGVGTAVGLGVERVVRGLTAAFMPGQGTPEAFGDRPAIWRTTLAVADAAMPAGVGPGGLGDALIPFDESVRYVSVQHAHMELLQAVAELGPLEAGLWALLVLVPLLAGLKAVLGLPRGRRRWLGAALVGSLVSVLMGTLWGFPLRIHALAMLTAVLCGALVALADQHARPAPLAIPMARGMAVVFAVMVTIPGLGLAWGQLDGAAPTAAGEDLLAAPDAALVDPDALRQAIRWQPLDWRFVMQLARQRASAGALDEALDITDQAIRLAPALPWPHVLQARLRLRAGDRSGSWLAWRRALALNLPDNDRAMPWLEKLVDGESDPGLVLSAVVPDRPDRLRDAAVLAARLGDPWTAQVFFARAVELDPVVSAAYARFLLGQGDNQEAARQLTLVPVSHRNDCSVLATRGEVMLAVGDPAEALALLRAARRACAQRPGIDLRLSLARALEATGDREGAVVLAELIGEKPDNAALRREICRALERQGRYEDMTPHLTWLVEAQTAGPAEEDALARLQRGLPPRYADALSRPTPEPAETP